MPQIFITFGQVHVHSVNGHTLDKDCVAVLECADEAHGRERAFELFDGVFCFSYYGDQLKGLDMSFYPRGLVHVDQPPQQGNANDARTI